jgi:hypothetical protein
MSLVGIQELSAEDEVALSLMKSVYFRKHLLSHCRHGESDNAQLRNIYPRHLRDR